MTAIPADRLRGVVALLGAGEITPCAGRLLLRLADEYDPPRATVAPEPGAATPEAVSGGTDGTPSRRPASLSPDCGQRKCSACSGDAWDLTGDRPAHCTCACHDVTCTEDAA